MAKSVRVTFRPRRAGVAAAGRSEGVYRECQRRAEAVRDLALDAYEPHRVTGDYGRGFHFERVRVRGMAAVRLINSDAKALILEKGTPPHVIEAGGPGQHNKQALFWPGAAHPVKRVNHPGTPAYNFLRNALRAAGR